MWPVARYVEFPHYRPMIISLHTLPRIPLLLALSSAILPLRLRTELWGSSASFHGLGLMVVWMMLGDTLGAASSPLNDWDLTVLGWGWLLGISRWLAASACGTLGSPLGR